MGQESVPLRGSTNGTCQLVVQYMYQSAVVTIVYTVHVHVHVHVTVYMYIYNYWYMSISVHTCI